MSPRSDSIEPSLPSLHQTPTNITLSPELFEKLYLTPKVPHVGDAYKRFANPTPMGFVGFVISTFSFAMVMMGWGGAAGLSGVAGIFFFVGPVLLLLGTIFEWVMGNFFPVSVRVFFSHENSNRKFLAYAAVAIGWERVTLELPLSDISFPTFIACSQKNRVIHQDH
jgi:hypothetical protein